MGIYSDAESDNSQDDRPYEHIPSTVGDEPEDSPTLSRRDLRAERKLARKEARAIRQASAMIKIAAVAMMIMLSSFIFVALALIGATK